MTSFVAQVREPFTAAVRSLQSGDKATFRATMEQKLRGFQQTNALKQQESTKMLETSGDPALVALAGWLKNPGRDPAVSLERVATQISAVEKAPSSARSAVVSASDAQALLEGMTTNMTGDLPQAQAKLFALARSTKERMPAGIYDALGAQISVAEQLVTENLDAAQKLVDEGPAAALVPALVKNSYSLLIEVRYAGELYLNGDKDAAAKVLEGYTEGTLGSTSMEAMLAPSYGADAIGEMVKSLDGATATSCDALYGLVNAPPRPAA